MTIRELYVRNRCFPYITVSVAAICVIATAIALAFPKWYSLLALMYPAEHVWQLLSGVFLHGTGDQSISMAFMHLCAAMIMFVPYAILLEKLIGHKRFLIVFLIAWIGNSLIFQIFALISSGGGSAYGAGLSGIAYAITVMGVYILYQLFKSDKTLFFKQPLTYGFLILLLFEIAVLNPYLAGYGSR